MTGQINMGQEVSKGVFSVNDFKAFTDNLHVETNMLGSMLARGEFSDDSKVTGFELEGWLVDHNYYPAPINEAFLQQMADPLVVSELSRFNIEVNGTPQTLKSNAFNSMQQELEHVLSRCYKAANELGASTLLIGTLPTLRNSDLTMANMSPMKRYKALNDQVLKVRNHVPIKLDINGREHLQLMHDDVMLEAATTSFQVHLQVPIDTFVRHFNASLILSAPIIAATANSPYLFGTDLWDETRIPLFEQAITTSAIEGDPRVSFGEGYMTNPLDSFAFNESSQPVLLPFLYGAASEKLQHLRLHNGTIWRWNRPLIGFNEKGQVHMRIEHRIMPSGPSIPDMIANAALYLGACTSLAAKGVAPESQLDFAKARSNFYEAARYGLDAEIAWLDGRRHNVRDLLLLEIIPMVEAGLDALGIVGDERDYYTGILRSRVESRQTGAQWQRAFIKKYGSDFFNMTANYLHHQQSGNPVHEWEI
ncbi:MAG TPA: glutamate-cysteine ligase family protein [Methylotenera sp.]|jgi:gamma-glutamyl:cysteine ligase YbdK (ATP-grasp superfamily)